MIQQWLEPAVLLASVAGVGKLWWWSVSQDRRIEAAATKDALDGATKRLEALIQDRATREALERHAVSLEQAQRTCAVLETRLDAIDRRLDEMHADTRTIPRVAEAVERLLEATQRKE